MSTPAPSDNNAPYFQSLVPGKSHYVDFTNTAEDTLEFEETTTLVEFFATEDCWVLIKESDSSSSAAAPAEAVKTNSFFCPGGIVKFQGLPFKRGVTYKASVVRNSNSGRLHITEGQ